MSRAETGAGLGRGNSTEGKQEQNAMWGEVGGYRGNRVATVARDKVEGSDGM